MRSGVQSWPWSTVLLPGQTWSTWSNQQVSANTDADLYGRDLVRAVIDVKWDSFARAFLLMQVCVEL